MPSGTVTFLFTDVEGSTRRWEEDPDAMRLAVARHDEVVLGAIEANRGYVFASGGDGFEAAFSRAADAVAAAQAAQAALAEVDSIAVQMGINTGEVHERDGNYFGPAVNRTARLMAAGHGGQVLISGVTAELPEQGLARLRPPPLFSFIVGSFAHHQSHARPGCLAARCRLLPSYPPPGIQVILPGIVAPLRPACRLPPDR